MRKLLLATVAAMGVATAAQAAPITGELNISGSTTVSQVGNTVTVSFSALGSVVQNGGEGSFAAAFGGPLGCPNCLNLTGFSYNASALPDDIANVTVYSSNASAPVATSFVLDVITTSNGVAGPLGGGALIAGTGTMTLAGFDPTPGVFTMTFQAGGAQVSFSATGRAIPEPVSLVLFGTGLLGLGLARRKLA